MLEKKPGGIERYNAMIVRIIKNISNTTNAKMRRIFDLIQSSRRLMFYIRVVKKKKENPRL